MKADTFNVVRHNDRKYTPPSPWNMWDAFAGCWTCFYCGSAAGYQIHHTSCPEKRTVPPKRALRATLRLVLGMTTGFLVTTMTMTQPEVAGVWIGLGMGITYLLGYDAGKRKR